MNQTEPDEGPMPNGSMQQRPLRRRLPAGVADATLASLAAFGVGLVAVNVFDPAELGVYAVFFAAFMLGTMVAYQLVYVPAEVVAAALPVSERLGVVRRSLILGIAPSLVGTLAILLATVATAGIATPELLTGLALTAWLATLVSPTQDHLRRLLHFRGWSWKAASVSAVQLAAVIIAVVGMAWSDVPSAWIPFGALSLANVASLSVALILTGVRSAKSVVVPNLRFRDLARPGRWLLLQAILPMAAAFIAAWMITVLATPEALGYADAARIAAQPILVLGMGLSAVLSPRAMEAAIDRQRLPADRTIRVHLTLVVLGGLAYLVLAGAPFVWNPMRVLVPTAYEISGLVAATIGVNTVIAFLFVVTSELAAARRERLLAVVSGLGGLAQIAATGSAGAIGAFARPLGLGASNAVRLCGYWYGRTQLYSDATPGVSDAARQGAKPGGIHSPEISEGNGSSGNSGR